MTLYLSNWSSHRSSGMHGPGRKWSIMANPRRWERGEGRVSALAPLGNVCLELLGDVIRRRRDGAESAEDMVLYRAAFTARMSAFDLTPGELRADLWPIPDGVQRLVADGDSLLCACSVEDARGGQCHRAWAAPLLLAAGWRVVLDGAELTGGAR